ncbi:MAG: phytanoyl-CoA dioxygenase family protein [Acidobacteriota bacterium]
MLRDPAARAQLEREGWVIVDFFEPAEIDELVATFEALHDFPVEGMFFSNRSPDQEYKARVQKFIKRYYPPKVDQFFDDAEWIDGVFIIKAPGAGEFTNHQDWSLVDEGEHRSIGIWAPLLDTDAGNGTFCVLPGSHRFHETYRSPTIPSIYARDELEAVVDAHRQVLTVRRGQAVLFDHALIHATTSNTSRERRSAAFVGVKPRRAEMRFYWLDPEAQKIEAFRIERDFLYRYDYRSRPEAPSLGFLPWNPPELSPDDLEQAISHHAGAEPVRVPWWRRWIAAGR